MSETLIETPVRYDVKAAVIRECNFGNVIARVGDGTEFWKRDEGNDRIHALGEAICNVINNHTALLAMLDRVTDIRGFSWHIQRRRENDKIEWFSSTADSVFGPFDTVLEAYAALKENR